MIEATGKYHKFIENLKGKELVCFCAGNVPIEIAGDHPGFEKHISYFIDNDSKKWGQVKVLNNTEIPIRPVDYLLMNKTDDTIVLITCLHYQEIVDQIKKIIDLNDTRCYTIDLSWYISRYQYLIDADDVMWNAKLPPNNFKRNDTLQIPKIIHYFWVGNGELPAEAKRCIESWKKFCPDYEIKKWDESNYDFTKVKYMDDAYKNKKWGFVPDYARLDIVYQYGGIYFDTDVEIVKNLDELLYNDAFLGFETAERINTGSGFGAVKGFPLLKKLRDAYESFHFIKEDGTLDLRPSTVLQTDELEKYGLIKDGTFQIVDGMTIYPVEYLCPISQNTFRCRMTKNTYSIHHFAASWLPEEELKVKKQMEKAFSE
ncbi:glycosyltransferase family 32 protein [Candidatus Clostridium helianthi]|jgi:hypothetical protein|uniref:Glycosyltransferase family 32 protein n=1 Tax=Candidatus Clostridium helianthi TaxID=3381660 RepID=A0ABW8S3I9_9CLOT